MIPISFSTVLIPLRSTMRIVNMLTGVAFALLLCTVCACVSIIGLPRAADHLNLQHLKLRRMSRDHALTHCRTGRSDLLSIWPLLFIPLQFVADLPFGHRIEFANPTQAHHRSVPISVTTRASAHCNESDTDERELET